MSSSRGLQDKTPTSPQAIGHAAEARNSQVLVIDEYTDIDSSEDLMKTAKRSLVTEIRLAESSDTYRKQLTSTRLLDQWQLLRQLSQHLSVEEGQKYRSMGERLEQFARSDMNAAIMLVKKFLGIPPGIDQQIDRLVHDVAQSYRTRTGRDIHTQMNKACEHCHRPGHGMFDDNGKVTCRSYCSNPNCQLGCVRPFNAQTSANKRGRGNDQWKQSRPRKPSKGITPNRPAARRQPPRFTSGGRGGGFQPASNLYRNQQANQPRQGPNYR